MGKRRLLLILLMLMVLTLSGCSTLDIFKSFIRGEPYQGDNPPGEGDNTNVMESQSLEDMQEQEPPDENTRQVTLYYRDHNGYIVPVLRNMPRVEGIAKATLSAMVDSPENRNELRALGLVPVIPGNTEIDLAVKEDGLVRANFSGEILKVESRAEEESLVSAIVYALTEFESIDKVQIMVNNEILETLTYGTDVSQPIGRGNINPLNNDIEGEHVKLTLYMYDNPTGHYTYFVPVTKNVPVGGKNIESAIKELIASQVEDLQLGVPQGTQVFGVTVDSGIAYVNFSDHLLQMTDADQIKNFTKAVALTLKDFGGMDGVQILVDGKEIPLSGETLTMPTFVNVY